MKIKRLILVAGAFFSLTSSAMAGDAGARQVRENVVVDMAGRSVAVSRIPQRVATLGSAPVINSFVFALGRGKTLINELPTVARGNWQDCCRFQYLFAPQIAGQPVLEGEDWSLKSETLLLLGPDVILTGNPKHVVFLEKTGIPAFIIKLNARGETNKEIMALLGKIYGLEGEAGRYMDYFDSVIRRVKDRTWNIREKEKTRVLYCNFRVMTQSSLTADWWIEAAGGISLGKGGPLKNGIRPFSAEQVLAWDPDVWIVSVPDEIDMVYRDTRFKNVKAVRDKKIYSVPVGSIRWSHPTSEQPLGVLWAAKLLYPERFRDLNIEAEMERFYLTFFRHRVTEKEVKEMLIGRKC